MLKLNQIHAGYGAIEVLKSLTLEVGAGEIVALLGANGAGKSTTLLTIAGVVPVRGGAITWRGAPLPIGKADAVLREGICLCPEGRHIFPRLTVLENLISGSFLLPANRNAAKLEEIFAYFPLLAERRKQLGGTLSGGEQQMLAIGRALMGEPKLLMLDEPSLGLAPQIVARIFEIIRRINEKGVPIPARRTKCAAGAQDRPSRLRHRHRQKPAHRHRRGTPRQRRSPAGIFGGNK